MGKRRRPPGSDCRKYQDSVCKAFTVFKQRSVSELAVYSVDSLLELQKLNPTSVPELVYGITVLDPPDLPA